MNSIIHLQGDSGCRLTPFFLVHAISGLALPYLRLGPLTVNTSYPDEQRAVYGINCPLFRYNSQNSFKYPKTLNELAALYIDEIKTVQPYGPYLLGGWSMGGIIAINMAKILLNQDEQVLAVVMIDSANP